MLRFLYAQIIMVLRRKDLALHAVCEQLEAISNVAILLVASCFCITRVAQAKRWQPLHVKRRISASRMARKHCYEPVGPVDVHVGRTVKSEDWRVRRV